jgi:hypothetical protein
MIKEEWQFWSNKVGNTFNKLVNMPRRLTSVVNLREKDYDVYIGRGSKWGNPFKIGIDGTRAEVIKKYWNYLSKRRDLIDAIIAGELDGKKLGCYCHPLPCHGDLLTILANGSLPDYHAP